MKSFNAKMKSEIMICWNRQNPTPPLWNPVAVSISPSPVMAVVSHFPSPLLSPTPSCHTLPHISPREISSSKRNFFLQQVIFSRKLVNSSISKADPPLTSPCGPNSWIKSPFGNHLAQFWSRKSSQIKIVILIKWNFQTWWAHSPQIQQIDHNFGHCNPK